MTSNRYPKLHELVATDYPEGYQAMLELDPEWYEEMAGIDPPRLLAIAKVTPEEIASHWAKWNSDPVGWKVDPETGEPIDSGQYPLSPEKMEYARAFTRAADAYSATGDMTGFQELGIFPPAGDPGLRGTGNLLARFGRGDSGYGPWLSLNKCSPVINVTVWSLR